ncbi:MAG TPA: universal stress protein, partial [Polyangiaceae bacterium]
LRIDLSDDVKTLSPEEAKAHLDDYVKARIESLGAGEPQNVVTHIRVGAPTTEVIALGRELDADLMVMGTHGRRGVKRLLLGSVAQAVARNAGCPVLVVRPPASGDHPGAEV